MHRRPVHPARIAALVALLQIGSPAQGQTAIQGEAPPRPRGPTVIDAQHIEGIADLEVTARGSVELSRDDTIIFSEFLRFNQEFGRIEASGGVRLQIGVDRFIGSSLIYDTTRDSGTFEQARYVIQKELTARGSADRIEFLARDRVRMTNATYTTCSPAREDWRLDVDDLELDYTESEGRAKGMRLKFLDTTVAAIPYALFPLDSRRKTGFLSPRYSQTTQRGLELSAPYYWNIAPERDLTLVPALSTKRGLQLKSEFRYLETNYGGVARVETVPSDNVLQRSRGGYALLHNHQFSPAVSGRLDLNKVSDDKYLVDFASDVPYLSLSNLNREGWLSYSGGFGGYSLGVFARVQHFQTLQDPLAPIVAPYFREPQINATLTRNDLGGLFDLSVTGEHIRFGHDTLVEGTRTSLVPTLSMPLRAPGWYVVPKVGLRTLNYSLDRLPPGQPREPNLSVPWLSLDGGLVFERPTRWRGQPVRQTLEPRLFYLRVPYRDQSQMPLFDTGAPDLSFAQLFSENRFAGGDRIGDANELTMALTSRVLSEKGQEGFRATVGQRFYLADERVGLTTTSPLRTRRHSDLLASVGGPLWRHWSFDSTMQYDPAARASERYNVSVRFNPEIARVINASYRFQRNVLRQIDVSAQWPIRAGWYGVGRMTYSQLDRRLLEGLAGFEYNGGCWVFRAVLQRLQVATQLPTTGLFVQLELNGLGSFGTNNMVDLLKRSVAGYAVSNPKDANLVPPSVRRGLPFEQVY